MIEVQTIPGPTGDYVFAYPLLDTEWAGTCEVRLHWLSDFWAD